MARVHTSKKNRGGKFTYKCGRCGHVIEPGEKYFYWEPRYGPKAIRCKDHYPRQSELTTSKMSEVYAACEEAEDSAQAYDGTDYTDYNALVNGVQEVAENVKSEYEDAAENFGGQGTSAEYAEQLEEFIGELDGAEFEGFDDWWGQNCPEDAQADAANAWREDMNSRLSEVLGSVP